MTMSAAQRVGNPTINWALSALFCRTAVEGMPSHEIIEEKKPGMLGASGRFAASRPSAVNSVTNID